MNLFKRKERFESYRPYKKRAQPTAPKEDTPYEKWLEKQMAIHNPFPDCGHLVPGGCTDCNG